MKPPTDLPANIPTLDPAHNYTLHGRRLIGCTEALKLALGWEYAGVPEAVLENKRELGALVDDAINLLDEDDLDETSLHADTKPYIAGYKLFLAECRPTVIATQRKVWSERHGCAGTLDKVYAMRLGKRTNPEAVLADIKCTAALSWRVRLQTAGYQMMWEDAKLGRIDKRLALHLTGDGKYRLVWYDQHLRDRADFLACIGVAKLKLQFEPPTAPAAVVADVPA